MAQQSLLPGREQCRPLGLAQGRGRGRGAVHLRLVLPDVALTQPPVDIAATQSDLEGLRAAEQAVLPARECGDVGNEVGVHRARLGQPAPSAEQLILVVDERAACGRPTLMIKVGGARHL